MKFNLLNYYKIDLTFTKQSYIFLVPDEWTNNKHWRGYTLSNIHVGGYVWIPCEVKPGTFSNEVFILVKSEFGDWVGFTHVSNLQNQSHHGNNSVKAKIIDMAEDRFRASISGESLANTLCVNSNSVAQPIDTVQT